MTDAEPVLTVDAGPDATGAVGISVQGLGPQLMRSLDRYVQTAKRLDRVLRLTVVPSDRSADDLPAVLGSYQFLADGIRLLPSFPLQPGLRYRAVFDPAPLDCPSGASTLTRDISLPRDEGAVVTRVTGVHPSGDVVPENLLRFYIRFSDAMERGRAGSEIRLFGPDGVIVTDALYRAPVELWDPTMRVLTLLLDPGRLKRGVGPNRALGPPLQAGETYTLKIGSGMTDRFGRALEAPFLKTFSVTAPVREAVGIEDWTLISPPVGTRQPLLLTFPKPLDWAMLFTAITISSTDRGVVGGRVVVDRCEMRWCLTPDEPWAPGRYKVRVASSLEDACGNDLSGPFDRPFRAELPLAGSYKIRHIAFVLAAAGLGRG